MKKINLQEVLHNAVRDEILKHPAAKSVRVITFNPEGECIRIAGIIEFETRNMLIQSGCFRAGIRYALDDLLEYATHFAVEDATK